MGTAALSGPRPLEFPGHSEESHALWGSLPGNTPQPPRSAGPSSPAGPELPPKGGTVVMGNVTADPGRELIR